VYAYDDAGNITSKTVYAYTTSNTLGTAQQTVSYTYGNATWGDLLTNWNGYAITYDTIGNPLQWKGASLTWKGRELQSYAKNADTLTFTYNDEGIRTSKKINNVTHTYTLSGSQILTEEWGNYRVLYLYDENGAPLGFVYGGNRYLYEKNIQGDIIGIFAAEGAKIGSYTYDAWGNCTVTPDSLATQEEIQILTNINPFRYRGYYYDVETGLYYLQSRYYDPEIGRFINADGQMGLGADLLGTNLFAYCGNNPVNRVDYAGNAWDVILDIVSLGFSIADVIFNPDDPWAWVALGVDVVCLIVPFASGGGAAVKVATKADDVVDVAKTVAVADNIVDVTKVANGGGNIANAARTVKMHGNSLQTTKETVGYALRKIDTGEIMKFGETTRGVKRYTKKFYVENEVYMDIMARGSKYDMHFWQHDQILDYTRRNGVRPPWNKSDW